MLQQGKGHKQLYYRKLNTLSLCRPVLFSGNVQTEQVALGVKEFKQRYYRNLNTLKLCKPVLLSSTVQSENVVAGESLQTTILSGH